MAFSLGEGWNKLVGKVMEWGPVASSVKMFDSLSPRDRRLMIFMANSIVLVLLVVAGITAQKRLRYLEQDIERKNQQLELVQQVISKYQKLRSQIDARENELRSDTEFNLTSFLEQKAGDIGMGDAISINSKGESAGDGFSESMVGVKLRKRSLEELVRYLYAIETAPQRLTVKSLRVRTSYRSKSELNISLDVTALKPQES